MTTTTSWTTESEKVAEFYRQVAAEGWTYDGPPRFLPPHEAKFFQNFIREELDEYVNAGEGCVNLVAQFDALIDLLIVVHGALYMHGFPVAKGFDAVMAANRRKKPGPTKRGYARDLQKPDGWRGPENDLAALLIEAARFYDRDPRLSPPPPPPANDNAPKDDDDKPPLDLVPLELMEGVARVMNRGRIKYGLNTWKRGLRWGRTFAALMRHLLAWKSGRDTDPEFGLPHLDHALTQLLMLRYYTIHQKQNDDRNATVE